MKKRYRARMVIAVLTLFAVALLAACGGNNGTAGNEAGNTGGEASAVNGGGDNAAGNEAAEETDALKSDVKLSLWHWKVAFDPGFKAVAEEFKKRTGVTVETQAITPDATYIQKVAAAATAGNLPDIYMYWSGPGAATFDGVAMNWQSELDADPAWKESFFPAAINTVTVSQVDIDKWKADEKASAWLKERTAGEVYGIPIDIGSNYVIYANKKLLEQAGIPAEAPASMEAWIGNMKTLKEKTGQPALTVSGKYASIYQNWFANFVDYMKNGPESFAALMNGQEKMTDPKHEHFGKFLEEMSKNQLLVPGVVSLDIDPSDQLFAGGGAGYAIGGTFTYASLLAMGMNPDDIMSFRVPAYEGSVLPDEKVTPIPLLSAVVKDNGPHKKEAVEFVKFLTSEEGQILYANGANSLPSVKLKDSAQLKPILQTMFDSLSSESTWWSENPSIVGKVFNPEWNKFYEELQKVMLGQSTGDKANEVFDKAIAAELAKQ